MSEDEAGEGQWLTYAEIAALTGKTLPAAQQHVRRKKWRKQKPNHPHDLARFWVPGSHNLVPTVSTVPTRKPRQDRAAELLGRAWDELYADRERLRNELANVRQDVCRLEALERERAAWGLRKRLTWAVRPTN